MDLSKLKITTLAVTTAIFAFSFTTTFEKTVYICNSTTSSKYHLKKNCRGLNACKKPTKEVTITSAKESGRSLCGWED
ncbi:hypothetical protein ULMS_01260 [Patiriisocius marinistellae]|uniref:Uncharacterized protein n=1 Tax=Patiriisocius marinistellae TaxID=2494560 RepID=A0A5J4FU65_9FLAO|nr:hypothetical protein [Patiriisocius marinistellae]GEQ84618.1 hypothetical protein ULMS_01260 [Patiriisocius marinistellae]